MSSTDTVERTEASPSDLITAGPLWLAMWEMSWPMVLNMTALSAASFAEVWVAGKIGPTALAGVGLAGQLWYFFMMLTLALAAGTIAIVSRYWGARDHKTAIEAARQSIMCAVVFSATATVIALIICRPLLHALGAAGAVELEGWKYMSLGILSMVPYTLLWITNSIFRSTGDARTPMVTTSTAALLVVIFDYALCLQPFHMGCSGLGLSWVFAASICLSANLWILGRSAELKDCLNLRKALQQGLSLEWTVRLMRIGIPSCVQDLALITSNFALFVILARIANPTLGQATWAVGCRIEDVGTIMPMYALNLAIATIVGQNLGARKPERAERAGWYMVGAAALITSLFGLAMFVFAEPFAHSMTNDPAVVSQTVHYLQITAASQPFIAAWLVISGALQGAGYTRAPMIWTVLCFDLVRPAIAWVLTTGSHGTLSGTWIAMASSAIMLGICMLLLFRRGSWKLQQI
jgi:putative MATE family efflux protein